MNSSHMTFLRRFSRWAVSKGALLPAVNRGRIGSQGFGAECLMTSPLHNSGTDRIAEVVGVRHFAPQDIVVNLQGDEPMMPPAVIGEVAAALRARPAFDMASAVAPIGSLEEFLDPACVKALRAQDGAALYFSRAPVPWPRDHVAAGRPLGLISWFGVHGTSIHRENLLLHPDNKGMASAWFERFATEHLGAP